MAGPDFKLRVLKFTSGKVLTVLLSLYMPVSNMPAFLKSIIGWSAMSV